MSDASDYKLTAPLLLIFFLWGSDTVAIKFGLGMCPPLLLAGLRYLIGGAVLLLISAFRSHHFKPRDYVPFALLGLISSVEFGCMYTGIQYLSAGLSAILYNTCPIWVALFAWSLLGETLNLKKVIGFAIGFLGVVFIFATGLTVDHVNTEVLSGAVLLILAALGYALVTIGFKKIPKNRDLLLGNGVLLLTSSFVLLPLSLSENFSICPDLKFISLLLFLALVNSAFGITIYFYILKRREASKVAPYIFLTPISTVILSILLLGESLTLTNSIGMICICLGIYVVNK
jgi:Predicted permease, DMT superfamily